MKKIIEWVKSPASDFVLFILLLALANIAGHNAFLRFDLTEQKSYSISEASRQTVSTLTEPLSVKVFFSDNLPSPYNGVAQYVRDILVEYKDAANRYFSYTFFDMNKPENQRLAQDYGLRQIQIQEVKNNEIGFKQAWMGLAISYGDAIETMDGITSDSGFEYNLTTNIASMISKADTLSALGENDVISVTLYATDALGDFRINGFSELDSSVQAAFNEVNKKNMNRMVYLRKNPAAEEIDGLAEKYGLQTFNWQNKNGEGVGIFGLVLEYGDAFRTIPLFIQRMIFGYTISGFNALEENISESLRSLLAKSTQIGYVVGHSETELTDENGTNLHFTSLLSAMYEFKKINLEDEDVPAGISTLIINGPKTAFSESELYKIDQFMMRGGNLMLFADPFDEQTDNAYQQTDYVPIDTGLDAVLGAYGITLEKEYVFDEECYIARQQDYGSIPLYWAPMMQKRQLSQKNPITKNLGYVIFLNTGAIDVSAAEQDKSLSVTVLAKSSEKSWTESRDIRLYPMAMQPPFDKSVEKAENLAVLVEGTFKSAFDKNPADDSAADGDSEFSTNTHISSGIQRGRIFVAGTSYITGNNLINESGSEPVALFVRNAVDYMNGNADLCTMRTKGLSLNTLSNTGGSLAMFVKYFNQFGLAVLVAIAGLLVWRLRIVRRKKIRGIYNPSDSREVKA